MTDRHVFSDDDLSLYIDGEAPQALVQAVEEALDSDQPLATRLDALKASQGQFADLYADVLKVAPPPLAIPVTKPAAVAGWQTGLVGLAAGIALAVGVIWTRTDNSPPGWKAAVASYQALYVTETLAGVDAAQPATDEKLADLSAVLGLDLTQLPPVDGLNYKRAQQLGFRGKPLGQITFLNVDGGPVALCIIPTTKADSPEITAETLEGLAAFSWIDNGYGVLLIGPQDDDNLRGAAERFRTALKDV